MTTKNVPPAIHAMIDQRIALIVATVPATESTDWGSVITPLTDAPLGVDPERWDRTCDLCGTYCPVDSLFYCGFVGDTIHRRLPIMVSFGLCPSCFDLGEES